MATIGGLLMPDLYDSFQQGQKDGEAQLQQRTLRRYAQPALNGDQGALAKIYGVDPDAGMKVQQQAGRFSEDANSQLGKFARQVATMAQGGDMNSAAAFYAANIGRIQQATGMKLGNQLDPAMLPHIQQIADALSPATAKEGFTLGPNQTRFGADGKPIATGPAQAPKEPEAVTTLRAVQSDPALMATWQKMHPRAVVTGGASGGLGKAPSGYRWNADRSALEPIPGGPADAAGTGQGLSTDAIDNAAWAYVGTGKLPAVGRGKEGVAQRTAVMNRAASIAKSAGMSPAELQTVPGRNKALQGSLANLQKQSDMMEKSEQAFQNNIGVALNLSKQLDRSGSPVINKWLLGGKAALGDPQVAAFDAAITTASVDYARIMSGQTGAAGTPISTAEEARKLIRRELSDKQFSAVADVLDQDIQGQKQAVHAQRGKILSAMQQMHDEASPPIGGQGAQATSASTDDSDPLGLLK